MTNSPEAREPVAVCITGMHRSGTSFIASALRFLGVSLGDPAQLLRPGPDNPKGYFEIAAVTQLDDELLAHLGGAWDQPPVLDPGWEQAAALDPFRERAIEILAASFGAAPERPLRGAASVIAWKDPRLSLLLPFWRTVAPIAKTIVVVRDPVEVAASLGARRYRVDAAQSASLWLRYLFAATANDPDHLLVRHRDIFDDFEGTLRRLTRHLGLPDPDAAAEASARADLDPELRHHDAAEVAPGRDDPLFGNPLLEWARAIWNGGELDLASLPAGVRQLLGRGWLRPPIDGELLARARADVVRARETLRKANRRIAVLEAQLAATRDPAG